MMKKLYFSLALFLFLGNVSQSQDTFSIIAVDPETGEVGAAGATCVDGIAQWGGIQLLNKIIPGRGGVNAQAWICLNPHINLDNAIAEMELGSNPDEIIDWLMDNDDCAAQNFNPEYRQYGIADFDTDGNPRTAAFTGSNADDYKGHLTGATYAIQGNILLDATILEGMENGFNNTPGSLADKLMAAMQGANVPGADARCLDRGTSSTTAFLRVVRPDDTFGDHYLELSILEMPFGEEPIDSLQTLFDDWKATISSTDEIKKDEVANIYPNPAKETINVFWKTSSIGSPELSLMDVSGKIILDNQKITKGLNAIEIPDSIKNQLLFIQIKNRAGELLFSDKILVE